MIVSWRASVPSIVAIFPETSLTATGAFSADSVLSPVSIAKSAAPAVSPTNKMPSGPKASFAADFRSGLPSFSSPLSSAPRPRCQHRHNPVTSQHAHCEIDSRHVQCSFDDEQPDPIMRFETALSPGMVRNQRFSCETSANFSVKACTRAAIDGPADRILRLRYKQKRQTELARLDTLPLRGGVRTRGRAIAAHQAALLF